MGVVNKITVNISFIKFFKNNKKMLYSIIFEPDFKPLKSRNFKLNLVLSERIQIAENKRKINYGNHF